MKEYQTTYLDYPGIMDTLKDYASPRSKLTTMIKKGELIKVRRGLYLPGDCTRYSMKMLANIVYGPSYISFESALSYYGFIPEAVQSVTSACYNKNKNKVFKTPVGTFIYRYVNPTVYPYDICRIEEQDEQFLIASPEKALCDTLSKVRGVSDVKTLEEMLTADLRVDLSELKRLDTNKIEMLSGLYKKRIINYLSKFLDQIV